ncbi:MAG: Gfo/Idh/MocA family oxidoreductase [bacterium]
MAKRRVLIVGSGERVRKAALPVFARASEHFELAGVVSRQEKRIESEGREFQVTALANLDTAALDDIDLVYMVVAKQAVPAVLARLAETPLSGASLLIETPVMLFRHMGHLDRLEKFADVWVSEDTSCLPCFAPIAMLQAAGTLGELRSVRLEESGYAYHGLAMAKAVLGCEGIVRARQRSLAGGRRERRLSLAHPSGTECEAVIIDPRDYSRGKMRFEFEGGVVSDHPQGESEAVLALEVQLEGDRPVAFRAGDASFELDAEERDLMGVRGDGTGLTAWMDGMKRVGFLALLRQIAAGRGAYPLMDAVEDAVVDYHLEKLGRYWRTPLSDPRRRLARLSYKLVTTIAR